MKRLKTQCAVELRDRDLLQKMTLSLQVEEMHCMTCDLTRAFTTRKLV